MWVIQNEILLRLPDDVPVPPNSRVVTVPEDFLADPRQYRIENGELVRATARPGTTHKEKLTRDDVARLKEALAAGAIGGAENEKPIGRRKTEERPKKKEEK